LERLSRAREQIFLSAFHRDDLRKHRHHRLLSYKAYLKLKTHATHALKNGNILYFRQKYFQHTEAKFKNTTISLSYYGHRAVAL
jgi:hypothetical protein